MSASKGSPFGRAPAIAGERVIVAIIRPLRRLRRHLSQWERLSVSFIITQIGRENNISADLCKHPYENTPKAGRFLFLFTQTRSYVQRWHGILRYRGWEPRCGCQICRQATLRTWLHPRLPSRTARS